MDLNKHEAVVNDSQSELILGAPSIGLRRIPEKTFSSPLTSSVVVSAKRRGKAWIVRGTKPLKRPAAPSAAYKFCKVEIVLPIIRFCSLHTIKTRATSKGWERATAPKAKPASIGIHSLPRVLGKNAVMSIALRVKAAVYPRVTSLGTLAKLDMT